jgi:hypothetical protein
VSPCADDHTNQVRRFRNGRMRDGQLGAVAVLLGLTAGALPGVADASLVDAEVADFSHA